MGGGGRKSEKPVLRKRRGVSQRLLGFLIAVSGGGGVGEEGRKRHSKGGSTDPDTVWTSTSTQVTNEEKGRVG